MMIQEAVIRFLLQIIPSQLLGFVDYAFVLLNRSLLLPSSSKFFSNGYGDIQGGRDLKEKSINELANGNYKFVLKEEMIDWGKTTVKSDVSVQEARFQSPLADSLPSEASHCKFLLVKPLNYASDDGPMNTNTNRPAVYVLMLPATGEMGSSTRLKMARELANEHGYTSLIFTAPYYGERKPKKQTLFFLPSVGDILIQAQGIIEESAAAAAYLLKRSPNARVCFTGFSFGAAMSSIACSFALKAGNDGSRISAALYAGSASPCVLSDGVLESGIAWEALREKGEEQATTRKTLFDALYKTQLSDFASLSGCDAAVVQGCSMRHDHFIKAKYAKEFEEQVQVTSQKTYQVEWMPGGHVFAALARPVLHKSLIEDTVSKMMTRV